MITAWGTLVTDTATPKITDQRTNVKTPGERKIIQKAPAASSRPITSISMYLLVLSRTAPIGTEATRPARATTELSVSKKAGEMLPPVEYSGTKFRKT